MHYTVLQYITRCNIVLRYVAVYLGTIQCVTVFYFEIQYILHIREY